MFQFEPQSEQSYSITGSRVSEEMTLRRGTGNKNNHSYHLLALFWVLYVDELIQDSEQNSDVHYYPHFTHEEPESERGQWACPVSGRGSLTPDGLPLGPHAYPLGYSEIEGGCFPTLLSQRGSVQAIREGHGGQSICWKTAALILERILGK